MSRIQAKVSIGCPPPSCEDWKSFMFHIHDFANLSTTRVDHITLPEFTCRGHIWRLVVFPGGNSEASEGNVSAYLYHFSKEAITASFDVNVIDKFGKAKNAVPSIKHEFSGIEVDNLDNWGWPDFISRSDILDESQNILDDNGTLTVVVSMEEEPTDVFVPKNPIVKIMQEMFNDETTADVCFEVGSADEKEGKKKKSKTSASFYAHRLILEKSAPMLAALCESNNGSGEVVTASVNDIKPEIFHYLLFYLYGGTIPEEELKENAKDIIDAADKYSIVNLKLEAEVAYVQSTDISIDNAMDNLLYADSRNCALLKEAVMNFLAENHREAVAHINFADFPGHVVKDLLVVFGRNTKKNENRSDVDELTTLSVSALRKKLHKMGKEVDGSREAMIEAIKRKSDS